MSEDGKSSALRYEELRLPQLADLPRERTVFFISVSPLEVHGPHLPLGTDVVIAGELERRYRQSLAERHADLIMVTLPPLYLGSDALPIKGSLSIPARALAAVLVAYGKGLAAQGFRYLFIADNHGGPRHQLAMEAAARRLWRRYKFYLINPFNLDFRLMVQHDPEFLRRTGLSPGTCGDDADSHAGTNETSLMLTAAPAQVDKTYNQLPPATPPSLKGGAAILAAVAGICRACGGRRLAADLLHLANTLAWVNDPQMTPYMGAPALATPEAGEAMLRERIRNGVELFEKALAGEGKEPVHLPPMLWPLRILRYLPE